MIETPQDRLSYLKDFGTSCTWTKSSDNTSSTILVVFNILYNDVGISASSFYIQTALELAPTIRTNDKIILQGIEYVVSDVRDDGSNWLFIQMDR